MTQSLAPAWRGGRLCYDWAMGTGQSFIERREDFANKTLFMLLVLGFPIGLAGTSRIFGDGDVSWHIAAGRWIIEHQAIPSVDPFSFTRAGHPWVAMEWPAEIIYATAYDLAGHPGLSAVVAAALMALHAILYVHLRRSVGPIGLAATLIAMVFALLPFLHARPHLLVWPLLAGWTVLLLRALERDRAPPLWGALLMVVWTNLHGSFPLAAAIGGAIALDAMIKTRWATLKPWLLFALASLAGALCNLNGLAGLMQPFHVARLETLHLIMEWKPSTIEGTPFFYVVLLGGLAAMLWRGVRVPPGRLALLLVLLAMAFSQVRHQSWFVIVAAAVIPPLFGGRPAEVARVGWLWAMTVPMLAVRVLAPLAPDEGATNPRSLIAAVPPGLRSQPVLNEYSFGGPLILAGIRPYIDGRSEMYGDGFVRDYVAIAGGDMARFDRAVERYDIRWTILPNGADQLVRALDHSPRWRRLHSDKVGVIHVRTD